MIFRDGTKNEKFSFNQKKKMQPTSSDNSPDDPRIIKIASIITLVLTLWTGACFFTGIAKGFETGVDYKEKGIPPFSKQ